MELGNLIPADFILRDTRFTGAVRINGKIQHAYIANTGRLPGLLNPGVKVWISRAKNPKRRTKFDLHLVEIDGEFVSVDTRFPNELFEEALKSRRFASGFAYDRIEREVGLGKSRIDFKLANFEQICWVETKSVTLVEDGIAKFPDAPSSRARKHLVELSKSLDHGNRAVVAFIVQRSDAQMFVPNWDIDSLFSETLINVHDLGVEVMAYLCRVNIHEIVLTNEIPCHLNLPDN
jgi:sugar fermentation stimulation protein A